MLRHQRNLSIPHLVCRECYFDSSLYNGDVLYAKYSIFDTLPFHLFDTATHTHIQYVLYFIAQTHTNSYEVMHGMDVSEA